MVPGFGIRFCRSDTGKIQQYVPAFEDSVLVTAWWSEFQASLRNNLYLDDVRFLPATFNVPGRKSDAVDAAIVGLDESQAVLDKRHSRRHGSVEAELVVDWLEAIERKVPLVVGLGKDSLSGSCNVRRLWIKVEARVRDSA